MCVDVVMSQVERPH